MDIMIFLPTDDLNVLIIQFIRSSEAERKKSATLLIILPGLEPNPG
jgi:hypothetical protein